MKKVAIQGVDGSNHYIVAQALYPEGVSLIHCHSFPMLAEQLASGAVDHAIMAIENSIAGALLPNYALIYQNDFQISAEFYLSISHNLMALPESSLEDIQEVRSHPMALLQCAEYFQNHKSIRLVEDDDTASVAARIQSSHLKGVAAIAPKVAAELYGLKVLSSDIQTLTNNATRFVVLNSVNSGTSPATVNKASVRFVTGHKRGSLATILNVLSDCEMNLTKIQSLPIVETPWKYAFFVDVTFEKSTDFEKAAAALAIMAEEFKVLGTYENQLLKSIQ